MDTILQENAIDFNSLERKIYQQGCKAACDYNTDEIGMRIFNSDGAKWIKNLHIDDTVQFQLDPFHVRQAIVRKVSDKNAKNQINKFLDELKIDEMLEYIMSTE